MALSETVKSSLRDAQEDLKNALACAARTEKPFISKNIADMIAQIENVIDASEVIDQIEKKCINSTITILYGCTEFLPVSSINNQQMKLLKNSDKILCEDTRRSIKLLSHYKIKKKLIKNQKFK